MVVVRGNDTFLVRQRDVSKAHHNTSFNMIDNVGKRQRNSSLFSHRAQDSILNRQINHQSNFIMAFQWSKQLLHVKVIQNMKKVASIKIDTNIIIRIKSIVG